MTTEDVQPEEVASVLAVRSALIMQTMQTMADQHYENGVQSVKDGTHRFHIDPDGAVYFQPRGRFVNRAEEREQKLKANAEAVEQYKLCVVSREGM